MKRLMIFFIFIVNIQAVFAQEISTQSGDKRVDSLKMLLSKTSKPMDRYNLLLEIYSGYYTYGIGENNADYLLEMLRIALQQKSDSLIAKSYNFAGDYYLFEMEDYNTALDYLFKAIPYAEKINYKRSLSSLYIDISVAFALLENQPQQLRFIQKAESNLPDTTNPDYDFVLLQIKLQYGFYYSLIHQPKMAIPYLNAATELNLKLNYPIFDSYIKTVFGNVYHQLGDDDFAAVYFKKCLLTEKQISLPYPKAIFKYYYTDFLISTNNYAEAQKQAEALLFLGQQTHDKTRQFFGIRYLKTIFEKQNKIDSAYYYSKQELTLRDSIFSQQTLNKVQALAFNEEVQSNAILEERKENIQYALITLGIVVLITLFLLLSRTVIVNEKLISFFIILGLLIVFEFINLLIHPWLALVTHESPVLMLLALVIIAALLIPLHHRLEKWTKEKMIGKNKAIRLTAAKKTIEKLERK
jgi:tetratricopeptide (TPR) repeat protein